MYTRANNLRELYNVMYIRYRITLAFFFVFFFFFFFTVQINESHYTYTVEDIRGANFKGLIIDSRLLA